MKLYYAPGACSMAPHIVAREAGHTFDLERVEKSGDWHQPWWADHENPCGRRWQGSTTELQRHWWTGPRQPGRRRSLEYASIAAGRDRRQGLRQSNSASADQGRRGSADHPEPSQRDQTGLLSEAFLSAAAQDRKLLLSYQGLAAHRHPLRQTRSKFPCRRNPRRRTLLDQAVSPDPSAEGRQSRRPRSRRSFRW